MADVEYKRLWMRVRKSGENSVLKDREMMFDPVAHEIRIGDGVNVFEDLTDIIHTDIGWYPIGGPLADLRAAIRGGTAATSFPVGTQVVVTYTDPVDNNEYELPWDIVSYRKVTTQDGIEHDAAILQAHYAMPQIGLQFDAPEPSNSDSNRQNYGSNRWRDSAIRQWLNSDAEANAGWWTAQTNTDAAPTNPADWVDWPGFLKCLPESMASFLQPVKVQTATANIDGNVVDTTYDKVWLPSKEELYSVVDTTNSSVDISGVEGPYWEYWKTRMGTSSPASDNDSSTNANRMTPFVTSPGGGSVVWFRSAYRRISSNVWHLYTPGYLNNSEAIYTYRVAPACAIF